MLFDLIDRAIYNSLFLHNETPQPRQAKPQKHWISIPHPAREDEHPCSRLRTDKVRGIFLVIFHSMKKKREWKGDAQFVQQTKQRKAFIVLTVMLACARLCASTFITKLNNRNGDNQSQTMHIVLIMSNEEIKLST